jgi:Ran GTPase-activating protein (RanGAP) involved in mRNA processing and transport
MRYLAGDWQHGFVTQTEPLQINGKSYANVRRREVDELADEMWDDGEANRVLEYLYLSGMQIGGADLDVTLYILRQCTILKHVDLSKNAFKPSGLADVVANTMKTDTLTFCDLSHNKLDMKTIEALVENLPRISRMTHFDASTSKIQFQYKDETFSCRGMEPFCQNAFADMLKKSNDFHVNCKHLMLAGNKIGDASCSRVIGAMTQLKNLQSLNLSQNSLTSNGILVVLAYARQCPHLLHLDLQQNDAEIEGSRAREVRECLQQSHQFTYFDLSKNDIKKDGARNIAAALPCLPNLTHFDISGLDFSFQLSTIEGATEDGKVNRAVIRCSIAKDTLLQLEYVKSCFPSLVRVEFTEDQLQDVDVLKLVRKHGTCLKGHPIKEMKQTRSFCIACDEPVKDKSISCKDCKFYLCQRCADRALGLDGMLCLTHLDLQNNLITGSGAMAIAQSPMMDKVSLKLLDFTGNNIEQKEYSGIIDALRRPTRPDMALKTLGIGPTLLEILTGQDRESVGSVETEKLGNSLGTPSPKKGGLLTIDPTSPTSPMKSPRGGMMKSPRGGGMPPPSPRGAQIQGVAPPSGRGTPAASRASPPTLNGSIDASQSTKKVLMRSLDLRANGIVDNDMADLAERLRIKFPMLVKLYMECNHVGNQGATHLARQLPQFGTLQFIHLSANSIGGAGAIQLAEAMLLMPKASHLICG